MARIACRAAAVIAAASWPLPQTSPDRDRPAAGDREHVVEVTADFQAPGGAGCRPPTGQGPAPRQAGGQQAALQRLGDGRALAEHAVDPDRDAEVLAELFGQGQVGDLEPALARAAAPGSARRSRSCRR